MKKRKIISKLKANVLFLWSCFKYKILNITPPQKINDFSQWLDINREIHVKLNDITHYVHESNDSCKPLKGHIFFSNKFVKRGDWDLNKKPIIPDYYNNHKWFRSTFQYFKYKKPLMECDEYILCKDSHKKKKFKTYQNLEKTYSSIKKHGYLSQKELGVKPKLSKKPVDDLNVIIDRNGNFLRVRPAANHRFAMAIILDIETVPVYVRGVHYDWALYCYKKHNVDFLQAINKELDLLNAKPDK